MKNSLKTPVLFLIFNRPDTTRTVFEAIREQRPEKLFIAADGPRESKEGEAERCNEARRVAEMVDWPCEVQTLFRDENLGCGPAVSSAISWFFENVPEGIILEDDTLPTPDFFRFCSELLEKYRNDSRVMEISGECMQGRLEEDYPYSYYFSNWDHIWGWATWRRAWRHFDYTMRYYPEVIKFGYLSSGYTSVHEENYMKFVFDRTYFNQKDVTWWSYQWGFARKINSGLVLVPTRNMVINLGLGEGATNTTTDRWGFLKHEDMNFPLKHPDYVVHDRITDSETFKKHLTTPYSRLKSHVKHWLYSVGLSMVVDMLMSKKIKKNLF